MLTFYRTSTQIATLLRRSIDRSGYKFHLNYPNCPSCGEDKPAKPGALRRQKASGIKPSFK